MRSTNLHLVDRRRFEPLPENGSLKKVKESLMESFKKKVADAVEFVSEASIYTPEETVPEHTTAQTIILTLYYGLLFGDLPLCEFIIQVQVPQLRSTFLRVWLADDFTFSRHDVSMVISMLSYMVDSKKVVIPNHILMIFGGLVDKYRVADCCSKELLALLNNGKVKNEEVPENTDVKENSSIFKNNRLNTAEREKNMSTTLRRTCKMKIAWFQINQEYKESKEVENVEQAIVNKEDKRYKDISCQTNSNICSKTENISPCSEAIQQDEPVHYGTRDISRTVTLENYSKPKVMEKYNIVDREGRKLLHRLAQFGRTEAVRRLLDEGVNPDVEDYLGKTPLHWAVEYGHSATVQLLLKSGANVNAKTKDGRTPLSFAYFKSGNVSDAWKIVVEYGGTI